MVETENQQGNGKNVGQADVSGKVPIPIDSAKTRGWKVGFLFRLGSWWLGCHYSYKERRFCINLIPCFTIWICMPGGEIPRYTGIL